MGLNATKLVSEYDQEISQSQTAGNNNRRQTKQSNCSYFFPIKMIANLEWTH